MVNPYDGAQWDNQIVSISHAHSRKKNNDGTAGTVYQSYLDNVVAGGATHIAYSNYYPSEPFCPLSDWFGAVPENVFCSPNAEHHNFMSNPAAHINGLGSTLVTGQYGGLTPFGMAYNGITTVRAAFKAVLNALVYDDAGGITINHPVWSELSTETVIRMLDIDSVRVLGIEIANSIDSASMAQVGWALDMWDAILKTGRRCWGFACPDHEPERTSRWTGRNILLLGSSPTSYDALKAYRDGKFYAKLYDSDLAFDSIAVNGRRVTVAAQNADYIKIVVDGVYSSFAGSEAEMVIPPGSTYCRAEAWMDYEWEDPDGEARSVTDKLFSNPIIFAPIRPYQPDDMIRRVLDL